MPKLLVLIRNLRRGVKWALGAVAVAVLGGIGGAIYASLQHDVHRLVHGPPPPLSFSVRHDEEGFAVVAIPRRAADSLAHVKGCGELERVAREAGGADPQRTMLAVEVHGRLADTVTIIGIRGVVLSRTRPAEGAEAWCQSAGDETALRMTFELDSRNPVALRMTGSADRPVPAGPYFANGRVITAAQHEVVPLLLMGVVKSHVVTWKIELTALVGTRRKTFIIDDHGRPFRSTPQTGGAPVYEWRWFAHPQDLVISKRLDGE